MKKFIVNCDFGGQIAPFQIMIGQPELGHHPLHFQAEWLSKEKGGIIPQEVMDSVAKLFELAKKHNVSLEELAVYALGAAQTNQDGSSDIEDSIDNNNDEDDDYSGSTESTEENAISDEEGSRKLDNAAEEYNNDTNTYSEESEHHKSNKGRKHKKK